MRDNMEYLVTACEMQEIDRITINETGIPGLVLMERAAYALSQYIKEKISRNDRILFVVETGNNGGDGIAAARILTLQDYMADIYVIGGLKKETDSFMTQRHIAENLGLNFLTELPENGYDVIVDGIFGVGLKRPVEGIWRKAIETINNMGGMKIAIDIPSGINGDNGQVMGCAVKADLTVTFGNKKLGMVLYPGSDYCGHIEVCDIGFPECNVKKVRPKYYTLGEECISYLPERSDSANKGTCGKLAIIAGSAGMAGAAVFSVNAAYRMGAGLVKLVTHENNRNIVGSLAPEAVVSYYNDEASAVSEAAAVITWADAVLVGPGISTDDTAEALIRYVMANATCPVIIDADGINIIAKDRDILKDHKVPVIITPHMMEMSRLTGRTIEELKENQISCASECAKDYNVTCVLKDARTVVAGSLERVFVNTRGNNGMATAGSGDVLAGIISGIVAAGVSDDALDYQDMAAFGVTIHALAGDEAEERLGVRSLMARNIVESIGNVLKCR